MQKSNDSHLPSVNDRTYKHSMQSHFWSSSGRKTVKCNPRAEVFSTEDEKRKHDQFVVDEKKTTRLARVDEEQVETF